MYTSYNMYMKHTKYTKKGGDAMDDKLTQEALEARRKYAREWRRRNRDKIRAASIRYWNKKAKKQATEEKPKDD